jgi:deferrochelatase/peroxidase EfeB
MLLFRFIDGTRNPDHLLRAIVDEAVIFPGDDQLDSSKPKKKLIVDNNNESKQEDNEEKEVAESDKAHVGGSYMYAGRFVHNLPKVISISIPSRYFVVHLISNCFI